jgi:hypothetical protein
VTPLRWAGFLGPGSYTQPRHVMGGASVARHLEYHTQGRETTEGLPTSPSPELVQGFLGHHYLGWSLNWAVVKAQQGVMAAFE